MYEREECYGVVTYFKRLAICLYFCSAENLRFQLFNKMTCPVCLARENYEYITRKILIQQLVYVQMLASNTFYLHEYVNGYF